MKENYLLFNRIVPEGMDTLKRRYEILYAVNLLQPAGRRSVASYLNLTERMTRNETERLFQLGLIQISKTGMFLTEEGKNVLEGLKDIVREISGISLLEKEVQRILKVKQVYVVNGDSDERQNVLREIGRVAAEVLLRCIKEDSVITLTGGSTICAMVENVPRFTSSKAKMVVPARGSVGHQLQQQSDALVAQLADKLNANYRLLNVSDTFSKRIMNEMKEEPDVKSVLNQAEQADVIAFGLSGALGMAEKRGVSNTIYDFLRRKQAVAEAFGYYFNENGEIVYIANALGIRLEAIHKIPCIIAAAGGRKKAPCLLAMRRHLSNAILITDEGAAAGICEIANSQIKEERVLSESLENKGI